MGVGGKIAYEGERHAAVKQYSLAQILAVWAAAAIPMAVLAWVVAHLLGTLLGGDAAFIKALLLCITAGLVWQFVLTMILTRREQGTLRPSRLSRRPLAAGATGSAERARGEQGLVVGGSFHPPLRPLVVLQLRHHRTRHKGLWRVPGRRGLGLVRGTSRATRVQQRARRGFAVPGLLPRLRGVFGRGDFVANGVLFAFYNLHQP